MEKLDKVIADMTCCVTGKCAECSYGEMELDECQGALIRAALPFLKLMDDVRKDIWDVTNKNHQLVRELKLTRAQRNSAWEKIARITGEREKAWLEQEGE